ncbi:MAG: cation:proton antiporter [Thermoleophilia bacterium]
MPVRLEVTLALLLALASLIAVIAGRMRLPYTIGLVLAGLVLGAVHVVHGVTLSANLVFYGFLPVLLFEAAYNLDGHHLSRDWRRIVLLTVPGVLLAFALSAIGVHWLGGTTWTVALLFGALIAATDPVSVVALFKKLGVPDRLTTLIEAESLFNDGTAAVVFAIVLAGLTGGRVGALGAVGKFVWMAVGGLAVGAAVGLAASLLERAIDEPVVTIAVSTIVAYGSFILGDILHMSGVVAGVTAGVVLGTYGRQRHMSPVTRASMTVFWDYAAFAANSLVFLLIGVRVASELVVGRLTLIIVAFAVTLVARAVTIYGLTAAGRLFGDRLPMRWQHALTWGGLRGTIALALVLSVPATLVGRDTLLVVTFGVVLLSLLVQGLTIGPLVSRLGLVGEGATSITARHRQALLDGFVAAHVELDRLAAAQTQSRGVSTQITAATEADGESIVVGSLRPLGEEPSRGDDDALAARIDALIVQRRRIDALNGAGLLASGDARELIAAINERISTLGERLGASAGQAGGPTSGVTDD